MIVDTLEDFAREAPRNAPLLGIDLGTKTIGLALSDRLWTIASPSHTLKRARFRDNLAEIETFLKKEQIGGVILGLPFHMDGTSGARVQATRAFARNLEKNLKSPVIIGFYDERLSTVEAERAMIDADMSRKKRSEKIDSVAAAIILQSAIDRMDYLGLKS